MSYDFTTTTHGKWILAGEHAVIRGGEALVFPIPEKHLTLSYRTSTSELNATYEGNCGPDTHLLFWSVLEQGMQLLGRSINSLNGHFKLNSNISIGVGMGASAALCVATARWFAARKLIQNTAVDDFAKELEHLFHGKSSGLDIAGVSASSGLYFKQGITTPLQQTWQPCWSLSSCEQIGITSHCITQVQSLWNENTLLAKKIDNNMRNAVKKARLALTTQYPNSLQMLADAINMAADCFQQWGLVSDNLHQHMQILLDAGAIAVKPTGSGGGGYVISLWDGQPPKQLPIELISV